MARRIRTYIEWLVLMLFSVVAGGIPAQVAAGAVPQTARNLETSAVPQNPQTAQAISQTGLLPVFAVEMNFDPSWVDGDNVPSKSPNYAHSGVNDSFQSAWDLLKPGGFNAIRFTLDATDPHSASRLANLCIWAKANNVLLIPVLESESTGNPGSTLLTSLISTLRSGDGTNPATYTQIAYFQIGKSFNIAGAHSKRSVDAQKTLLSSADALRSSELQALQGTTVQATPIMVGVSFDYELVQQGAIAGVALDPAVEQKAQAALANDLAPFAADANIDAVNVAWFPGSISSGDQGHFGALLRTLQAAIPQKQVVLTTGYSTAFNPPAQQSQFLTVTLTNLWDFRLSSGGASSTFVGVILAQALQGAKANLLAPAGTSDPSQWNWSEKAKALAQMWTAGKAPDDLKWWLGKTEANMGLLSSQPGSSGGTNFLPLPALQTLQQISTTVAQAAQNITPPVSGAVTPTLNNPVAAAINPGAAAMSNPGVAIPAATSLATYPATGANVAMSAAPSAPSPYQQMLITLIQQVTPQITGALITKMTGSPTAGVQPQYPGYPAQNAGSAVPAPGFGINSSTYQPGALAAPAAPGPVPSLVPAGSISLGPQDVTVDAANAIPGQTVHVTAQIHNLNPSQDVSGLTVQLVDPMNPAGSAQNAQTGILVPHSGTMPVQFAWVAGQTSGNPQLSVQVIDPTGTPLASAGVPLISIMNAAGASSGLVAGSPAGISPSSLAPGSTSLNPPTGIVPATSPSGIVPPLTTNPIPLGVATAGNSLPPPSTGGTSVGTTPSDTSTSSSTGSTTTTGSNTTTGAGTTSVTQTSAGSGSQPASGTQSTAVAPHIAYFGPVSVRGQPATFLVQAVNPSPSAMSSVQAQIYVDGIAGQLVQFGPMLPQQSRSVIFDQASVSANSQTVTVVVTTTDTGASTTASAAAHSKNSQKPNPDPSVVTAKRVPVRSGIPASSSAGVSSPGGGDSGSGVAPPAAPPSPLPPAVQAASSSQTRAAGQPGGKNLSNQPVPPVQSTVSASPSQPGAGSPALSTPPTSQTAGGSQPTGASSNQTSTPTPSTGSVRTNQTDGGGSTSTAIPGGQNSTATSVRNLRTPPTVQPASTGSANSPTAGAPGTSTSPMGTVRTIQPSGNPQANQTPRTIQPPGSGQVSQPTASGQASNSGAPVQMARTIQPSGRTPLAVPPARGGQAYLDLSVSPSDIRIGPASQPGQVNINVLIHNVGTVGANGASVIFRLMGGGRQIAAYGPVSFNIQASGTYGANWMTPVPPGQALQVVVSVSAVGDVNPANNQAVFNLTVPQPVPTRH